MENLVPIKLRLAELQKKNKRTLKSLVVKSNIHLGFPRNIVRLYKDGFDYYSVELDGATKIQLVASVLRSEFGHRRTNILLPQVVQQ